MANSSILGASPDELVSVRRSAQKKTLLVLNNAAESLSTTYAITIDPVDIEDYDRVTIQIRNTDASIAYTAQVFGTLFGEPSAPATAAAAGSHWCQIGDDITCAASSGTLKSISTTGLRQLCVRIKTASSTDTLDAGNCIVFCQGTI